jgi:phage N-6-adenine-methyltransferase
MNSIEWYTPKLIIDKVHAFYNGQIDLDPASCQVAQKIVQANHYYTASDNGLLKPWYGNVWCNPPYGKHTEFFVNKALSEYGNGSITQCLLLLKAATDTKWFFPLFNYPICFIRGRLKFYSFNGYGSTSATFPSVIVYLGNDKKEFFHIFSDIGEVLTRLEFK